MLSPREKSELFELLQSLKLKFVELQHDNDFPHINPIKQKENGITQSFPQISALEKKYRYDESCMPGFYRYCQIGEIAVAIFYERGIGIKFNIGASQTVKLLLIDIVETIMDVTLKETTVVLSEELSNLKLQTTPYSELFTIVKDNDDFNDLYWKLEDDRFATTYWYLPGYELEHIMTPFIQGLLPIVEKVMKLLELDRHSHTSFQSINIQNNSLQIQNNTTFMQNNITNIHIEANTPVCSSETTETEKQVTPKKKSKEIPKHFPLTIVGYKKKESLCHPALQTVPLIGT